MDYSSRSIEKWLLDKHIHVPSGWVQECTEFLRSEVLLLHSDCLDLILHYKERYLYVYGCHHYFYIRTCCVPL